MDDSTAPANPTFEITMKKSSFKALTVPASFIREYGDKFKGKVRLGYGQTKPQWQVGVNVYIMKKKHAHVSFGGGWKVFARANGFHEGDILKFELVEDSGFTVAPASNTNADTCENSDSDDD